MVTTIGLSSDFHTVLKSLIGLDYDAAKAYQAAIDRLENPQYKQQLAQFREDHLRHIRDLSAVAREIGMEPPDGPDIKEALTKGKVVISGLFGDKAILMAMKTNEDDTNTAYDRASKHDHLPAQARGPVERGLADERRHRQWIVETLDRISHKAA